MSVTEPIVDSSTGNVILKPLAGIPLETLNSKANAAAISSSDKKETTTTATKPHTEGDYFELNGVFVKAIDDIAVGDTLTENSNYVATDVGTELSSMKSNFQAGCNTIVQAVTAMGSTPASNSPSDIATAIGNITSGPKYEDGHYYVNMGTGTNPIWVEVDIDTYTINVTTEESTLIGKTVTLTYDTNKTMTATISAQGTASFTLYNYTGDVTVSASDGTDDAEKTITIVSGTSTYNVELSFASLVSWSSGTDEEISAMIDAYYAGKFSLNDIKSVWSVGDVRNVNLSAMSATGVGESHRAQTVQVQIIDFDHDTLTTPINGKTKALITVDLKNCLRDASVSDTGGLSNTEHGYMNSSNTNVGGWTSCARRTWCNDVFYAALPTTIKSKVKPVNKLTSAGNQSSTINTDSDKCFLLSEIEIFGTVSKSKSGEGTQYTHYATAANRYKLPKWNASSSSDFWWERSPSGSGAASFCVVGNSSGSATDSVASYASGLALAFAL